MNAPAFLAAPSQAPIAAQQTGVFMVLRCVPDAFTGERLNVGVAGIDAQGQRACKVISEPGRLECLYGEAAATVVLLAKAAEEAFMAGAPMPSSQLTLTEPMPLYHTSLADALVQLFADQVTVALPHRQEGKRKTLDDQAAWTLVSDHIKQLQHLHADVIAGTPHVLVETERGKRAVTVPLQARHGVGTVRSADYAPATLKTHLMDSLLDLECAARYRNKRGMGIFILRPEDQPDQLASAVDTVIDSIAFRAPRNLHIEVSQDGQALARHVAQWAAEMSAD